jgi:hypothetical protein
MTRLCTTWPSAAAVLALMVSVLSAPAFAQAAEQPPAVDLSPTDSDEIGGREASSEQEATKDPCLDVYDRSDGCEGLMNVPVDGMAEPISEPEDTLEDETFLFSWFSNDFLNWGLLGLASVAMIGAVGFHAASFFYAAQLADQARLGQIGPAALSTTSGVQTLLGVGAGAMWVSAAMFGGAALALWAFDPETGAIRLPFFDE